MKASLYSSLAAATLLQVARAQPAHVGGHAHQHARRDVVTSVAYVTAATPDVMVYVNQHGEPISTSYANAPTAEPTVSAAAAPVAAQPQSEAKSAPASSQQAPPSYSAPSAPAYSAPAPSAPAHSAPAASAPAYSAPAPSASASSGSSGPVSGSGLGINYSPYHADQSCKSADEVSKDFETFGDYSVVRSYGTDCNQVPNMINAAKSKKMKIMLGVYSPQNAAAEAALIVSGVKSAAGGDWSMVHSVTVGNEAVNSGQASVAQVLAGYTVAKGVLLAGGYTGKTAIVDTFDTLIKNPELCKASDYAAANAHAFFDSQTSASQAGKWAQGTVQNVKQACGKDVIITESGWPTQGSSNGAAVPSKENQQAAMSSLKSAFPNGGLFLFSAFNDLWKQDFSGSFGCEKYWGIYGDSSN